jgi:hypothetical protein
MAAVAPTILDWTAVTPPKYYFYAPLPGRTLLPIFTPGAKLGKRTLAAFLHQPSEELYELSSDPDEVVNLAGDSKGSSRTGGEFVADFLRNRSIIAMRHE